jgi:hypothetical protein
VGCIRAVDHLALRVEGGRGGGQEVVDSPPFETLATLEGRGGGGGSEDEGGGGGHC